MIELVTLAFSDDKHYNVNIVWVFASHKNSVEEVFRQMEMTTVSMTVPKEMAPFLTNKEQDFSFERNAMMLYPFIRKMIISHGRAAEILGVRKWDLIEFYNSVGLPYLNQSKEELISDLKTFERVKEKLQ